MTRINPHELTDRQKLIIQNGINYYRYIQTSYQEGKLDQDFKDTFTDFYLGSQGLMRREENQRVFFDVLKGCKPCAPDEAKGLLSIVEKLHKVIGLYEFSFSTKLLHTVNAAAGVDSPIYDRKIRDYLRAIERVRFKFDRKKPSDDVNVIIKHDWSELVKWYKGFIQGEGKEWINWFDKEFEDVEWIRDYKKIDFIIFACTE